MTVRQMSLYFVAIAILVPTTLAAAPLSLMGFITAYEMLARGVLTTPLYIFAAVNLGAMGIASAWLLFKHFRQTRANPPKVRWYCAGLFAGAAVSLTFIITSGGPLFIRGLLYGWPLLGAAYFLALMFLSRRRS